ncbi:unnamed protein product [Triticum turgidum subsp. durum]|uniref:RING-type E3 ubiquitin transferase n=1 Tax=Triticum turgidum subsp. durum TaxID=4567 RepID=A0A9R0Y743_TRITD|nr:unnamed protein product [Triticum turgidum subsp. durum]
MSPGARSRKMEHALLAALLACALASAGSAQPAEPRQGGYDNDLADQEMRVSTTMVALLAAVVAVFFFILASIIYLRHCTGYSYPHAPLECAVCLSEFEDEDRLRLLPKCSHAFHPDCIGEWLASHVTCPVCRRNLDPSKDGGSDDEASKPPVPEANSSSSEITVVRHHQADSGARPAAMVIDVVTEEEAEQRMKEAMELQRIGTQRRAMRSGSRPAGTKAAKLVRSYSAGHSLAVVRLDRDLERFTLWLPEHVRREMVAAAGEQSSHRRAQRAGRWPSFLRYTRTLSGRFFSTPRRTESSEGGEASSSSSTRIRGKRVAAVDFLEGSPLGGGVSNAKVGSVAGDVDKAASRQVRT